MENDIPGSGLKQEERAEALFKVRGGEGRADSRFWVAVGGGNEVVFDSCTRFSFSETACSDGRVV